ncbi:mannose-P-dolichol utilization defect 1 protein [Silurus asotus]|uniref:Mannose-P-dolichol utilization defect 1 protein n=1 Tax=Silurus asotus TaxID=30991 RepID=A0AAD5AGT1_SILAS|nr:mannose-P-dolichol utilization defect 1 protein [Silurus asotus]
MEEEQSSLLKTFLITYIFPEKCYEHLFLTLNLTHGPCLKIVLSKILSVWMLGELIAVFSHNSHSNLYTTQLPHRYYKQSFISGCVILSVYSGVMYLLISALIPKVVVMAMQEWSVLIIIISRMIQAGCNLNSGSTGQLSAASVFLVFLASLGRTFKSTQESGSLHVQAGVFSSCCSLLLLIQIHIYTKPQSNRDTTCRKKEE